MSTVRLSGWDVAPDDTVSPSDKIPVPPPLSLPVPPKDKQAEELERQRERERRNAQLARERTIARERANNPRVTKLRETKVTSPNGMRSKSLALNYHTDRMDPNAGYVVKMSKTDKRKLRKKRQQERAVRVALALAQENVKLREIIDDMY